MKNYWLLFLLQAILIAAAIFNISFKPEVLAVKNVATSDWTIKPIYTKNYFDNGAIKEEGRLLNAKKTGWWKTYSDTKSVLSIGEYKEDLKQGYWKYYHENGEISKTGNFDAGKKVGNWKKTTLTNN